MTDGFDGIHKQCLIWYQMVFYFPKYKFFMFFSIWGVVFGMMKKYPLFHPCRHLPDRGRNKKLENIQISNISISHVFSIGQV